MCKLGRHTLGQVVISKLGLKSKALSNMHLLDNFAEGILRRNDLKKQRSIKVQSFKREGNYFQDI